MDNLLILHQILLIIWISFFSSRSRHTSCSRDWSSDVCSSDLDRAILLSDPRFAASDTLATSYVLGMGIRKIGNFDLILCGMRTADSDTAQVGPQLAEELDVPQVTGVEKLERKEKIFRIERTSDGFREILEVSTPALLTISPKAAVHLPSLIEIQDAFPKYSIE